MLRKRLILLLFALVWLMPAEAKTAMSVGAELSVSPDTERPQWDDLGMHDVLAFCGSTTLAPPTSVRAVEHHPSIFIPTSAASHWQHIRFTASPRACTGRVHSGYLYLLRCLRL